MKNKNLTDIKHLGMAEILGGESVTQVAEVIECYLQQEYVVRKPQVLLYDDACHLQKHVACRHVYPKLQELTMKADKFHFRNHTDYDC